MLHLNTYRNNSTSHTTDIQIFTTRPNQTIYRHTITATNKINDAVLRYTETFNKSIEVAQKYYNDSIQNYFNFLKKIEQISSNQ